jgi:hypothetical protein
MKAQHLRWPLGLALAICLTTAAPVTAGSGQGGWSGSGSSNWWSGGSGGSGSGGSGSSGGTSSYVSPIQSTYRELGWSIAAQVEVVGCDAAAQAVQALLPSWETYINSILQEGVAFAQANQCQLDPSSLYFYYAYAPRIYMAMDGGWYTDGIGVTIGPAAPLNGQPTAGTNYLVFPNGNMNYNNNCPTKQVGNTRTTFCPLLPGDFVQLPTVQPGQQLSLVFFSNVNSNGVPTNVFYEDPNANCDGMQHMVAFFPSVGSQYIIIGFEDEPKSISDFDYNDMVIIVDVGPQNAAMLMNNSSMPK